MFNVCILTGPVLTEPKLKFFEGQADTMFYIGISLGPYKAGVIRVSCPSKLAPVAEDSIHRGDRVAVVGVIGRYVYEDDKLDVPHELVLVAQDFELVRSDSPVRK
jgi:single-stranded DNA-binding protein